MIPVNWYLILGAVLFLIGVLGFFVKRNIIALLLSVEIMLNAVNLTFVAFSSQHGQVSGQIFVFFVLVVAAAEAAVGLALVIAMFRNRESLNVDRSNLLKWRRVCRHSPPRRGGEARSAGVVSSARRFAGLSTPSAPPDRWLAAQRFLRLRPIG